jgi:hypothetical protein
MIFEIGTRVKATETLFEGDPQEVPKDTYGTVVDVIFSRLNPETLFRKYPYSVRFDNDGEVCPVDPFEIEKI